MVKTQEGRRAEEAGGKLGQELETLRLALAEVSREGGKGGKGRGMEITRLCDSIARVQLAREKLAALEGGSNRLRREVERILREVGLGEF